MIPFSTTRQSPDTAGCYLCPSCGAKTVSRATFAAHMIAHRGCAAKAAALATGHCAVSVCCRCGRRFHLGDEMHLDTDPITGRLDWWCAACYDAPAKRAAAKREEIPV